MRWQQDPEDTATIQGYKLYYKEEGQQESGPILLDVKDFDYNIGGLGKFIYFTSNFLV